MHENTIPPKVMCPNVTKKEKKRVKKIGRNFFFCARHPGVFKILPDCLILTVSF